jgi:hypothetical protein
MYCENVEVWRCKKAGFALVLTQNSTFVNCFAQYNAFGFVFANGARNNNFFGCTSANFVAYYNAAAIGVPWADTACIYFVNDTTDPDWTPFIAAANNDRNNFYGGIHEAAGYGILCKNVQTPTNNAANINQFYGVEFTNQYAISTANGGCGCLLMDSCAYIGPDQSTPMVLGTIGRITFKGEPYFSGANLVANRGFTISSNYASLFVIDTNLYYDATTWANAGTGTVTYNSSTGKFTCVAGSSENDGIIIYPARRGNVANGQTLTQVGKPAGFMCTLTFYLVSITGSNSVIVAISLNGSPWVRNIATPTTAGIYILPVYIGENSLDNFAVRFSNNGNAQFVVRGITMISNSNIN